MDDGKTTGLAGQPSQQFVERACGHLEYLFVWKDERRKAQFAVLESHPCKDCLAAGWKALSAPATAAVDVKKTARIRG